MSSDFLQDLVCTCKDKSVCLNGGICFEQNLSCRNLCPCQAIELCRNVNTNYKEIQMMTTPKLMKLYLC